MGEAVTVAEVEESALLCVAEVGPAHGVRGAFRLRCFTEDPSSVAAYGPVCDRAGLALFQLTVLGLSKGGVVARARGVDDREAAEALRGMRFYVARRLLPAPAADEFYHADLIGLDAVDHAGNACGKVVAVHNFGAGDLVEIQAGSGEAAMIPFTREAVPAIDLAQRRMIVDLPVLS